MSAWSDYYLGRIGDRYPNYCRRRYQPLLRELVAAKGFTFREEGCGIGTISKILLQDKVCKKLELCDNDRDILDLAYRNITHLGLENTRLSLTDVVVSPHALVDVIFAHGVLEHFSDEEIQAILRRQISHCGKVVHYVPTNGYAEPSFGDERLLAPEYWVDKWSPTRHELFNDNKDLLLIWE